MQIRTTGKIKNYSHSTPELKNRNFLKISTLIHFIYCFNQFQKMKATNSFVHYLSPLPISLSLSLPNSLALFSSLSRHINMNHFEWLHSELSICMLFIIYHSRFVYPCINRSERTEKKHRIVMNSNGIDYDFFFCATRMQDSEMQNSKIICMNLNFLLFSIHQKTLPIVRVAGCSCIHVRKCRN